MIRVNAGRFRDELMAEFEGNVEGAVLEMTRRIALHVRDRAEENSPRGTGPDRRGVVLAASHSVTVGDAPRLRKKTGTREEAEQELAHLTIRDRVFVSSSDFTASFFENGTAKMAPRPLYRPAIEETRSWVG